MYYQLNSHCALVAGAKRGAIYDFNSGKVYSLNAGALHLLQECRTKPFTAVTAPHRADRQSFFRFLNSLTAKGLGGFFRAPTPPAEPPALKPYLDFLWLELTSACNNKCLHCYAASSPATPLTGQMTLDRWRAIIKEARQLNASGIQLIGGEPLLYPGWQTLVEQAAAEKYDLIEIFTNATLIDASLLTFFQKYQVHIATTIYAGTAAVHDQVTANPGSFDKTVTAVKLLLAAGIPVRIASILMKANEQEVDNIARLCAELGVEAGPPDVVRPTGRGMDSTLLPTSYKLPPFKPPFYTDAQSFARARNFNSCLAGKLAITADGEVIPCIFARNMPCGNVRTAPLAEIINGPLLQDCWQTGKDRIPKCRDCEYRYACPDCRPLAQGNDVNKRWLAPVAGCPYDPYRGQWDSERPAE